MQHVPDIQKIWVYRMIAIQNLAHDLEHGLYAKNRAIHHAAYVSIGSLQVIGRRDMAQVKCHAPAVVNDYVPFYFFIRTPMLYNIITGRQGSSKPQEDIVYLCCRLTDLAAIDFQWCFTDGNAAAAITRFFTDLKDIDQIDWVSIETEDFRDDNVDGDEDRIRKKHAEFLVKGYVPIQQVRAIVVKTHSVLTKVEDLLHQFNLAIPVSFNTRRKFYFQ